jgi:hypothetical protein
LIFLASLFSSVTGITRVFANNFSNADGVQYIYTIYGIRCAIMAIIAIISMFVLGLDWPRKVQTRTRRTTILYDMNANCSPVVSPYGSPLQGLQNMRMSGPRPVLVNMVLPAAAHFTNANDAAMPSVSTYANQYPGNPLHNHQMTGTVTPPSAAYFLHNNLVSADGSIACSNDYFGPIVPDIARIQSPISESTHEERTDSNKVELEGKQQEKKNS